MIKTAHISECNQYRYSLTRVWNTSLPMMTWCMLNPSTADVNIDDPTIRKCIGFAKRWGFGGIVVINLFAFRETYSRRLNSVEDPVGPDNMDFLMGPIHHPVVVGWGASASRVQVAAKLINSVKNRAISEKGNWFCLGYTRHDEPRHPLMLAYKTEKEPWPVVF